MKINHSSLHTANGTAYLRFPLNAADLREINKRTLFGYNPQLFENDPPESFEKGELIVAGAEEKVVDYQSGQPFELNPAEWQVMELVADEHRYPTFFQLRLEGKYPGNFREALLEFSIQRTTRQEKLPEASATLVRSIFSNVVGKIDAGITPSQQTGEELVGHILKNIQDQGISLDPMVTLEKILSKRGIPFTKEDTAFYFSVDTDTLHWEVEMGITTDNQHIGIYSSCPLTVQQEHKESLHHLLDTINENDPSFTIEWEEPTELLFIYNQCTLNLVEMEKEADALLTENLNATRKVLSGLKAAMGEKIQLHD